MRVLHLGKYFPPRKGGIEQFLADLLPALRAEGVEVAALVHGEAREVRERPFPLVRARTPFELLYAPISPSFPLELRRLLRAFRPDLLHAHLPNPAAFWTLLLPEARRIPLLLHWHADVVPSELDPRLRAAYSLYRPLEERLLKRAEAVIATSPPYASSSPPLAPFRQKVRVVPLGVAEGRLAASQGALTWAEGLWPEGLFRLLHVGRLTYYKGHRLLLEAVAAVPEAALICVGKGPLEGELSRQIGRLGLKGRVLLLGEVEDRRRNALLLSCHLLLLPSLERTEAFGLVLLEAMALGVPVVAADIPGSGVGWVVRETGGGLLVPPGEKEALKRAILELKENRELRRELGARGRAAFRRRFRIEEIAREVAALYQEVAARRL